MDIRDYILIIWKRKGFIMVCAVIALIVGIIINFAILKPVYRAQARILVEQPARVIMFTEKTQSIPSPLSVETQKRLLKSIPVGTRAAYIIAKESGKEIDETTAKKRGISYMNGIIATSDEDTGIITVAKESGNPLECQEVTNAYATAFADVSKEYMEDSAKNMMTYLEEQLKKANDELDEKEAEMFTFNQEHGVVLLNEELAEKSKMILAFESMKMETQLMHKQLETEIANLEAIFTDKMYQVAQDPTVLFGTPETNISQHHAKMVELEVERAALMGRYKPTHPVIKDLDKRIDRYSQQIEQQVNDIINNRLVDAKDYLSEKNDLMRLKIENELSKTKISQLDNMIRDMQLDQGKYPKLQFEFSKLLRKKGVAEKLYLLLYEQYQHAKIEEVKRDVNVRVFETANKPETPVRPNRLKNIVIFTTLGFMLGVGLAFLLEEMEETIRTSDDVKNHLNLPVLGSIPYSAETINKLITDVPLKSPIAEAYRRLSFFTQLFCLDPPIKSLLITSSKSDEGKTTTLANLAISMAQEGTKVLIVDTDLRRPMLHRMFGVDNSIGISSILTGELEAEIAVSDLSVSGHLPKDSFMEIIVDRLIQPASIKGLSIIPSGPLPANSIELLRSERMLSFLRCAEKKADIIIFDSPPAIHVIDSVVLAQILDGVLFIINSGRINRDEALQVKYMIESTKTPIIGVALNNIEASSPDYYYYYYYGGYGYGSRQRRKRVKLKR